MEEDILGKVVGVEKEIRERLEAEKEKASKWLADAAQEAKKGVVKTRAEIGGSFTAKMTEAKKISGEKASRIIVDAKSAAERLEGLESEKLKEIVLRHISTILQGD